ncbi:MAG: hypothetical protein AAB415_01210 [Patescibacteria group bacterium]
MNCYTVSGGKIHLGMALSLDEARGTFCLPFGKERQGSRKEIFLAPVDPASHALVAGGIHLMRTTTLLQVGGSDEFVLAKAKYGLKPDFTDQRALVFLDFMSLRNSVGSNPATYSSIPVSGFEVLQRDVLYRVQSLIVLGDGQHISYYDCAAKLGYTIAYDFDSDQDRFPKLSCIPTDQWRARESKKLIAV